MMVWGKELRDSVVTADHGTVISFQCAVKSSACSLRDPRLGGFWTSHVETGKHDPEERRVQMDRG